LGTYLIPFFTGEDASGHWSFIVVNRQHKIKRMWVIDSLGRGNRLNRIVQRVREAFSTNRCKCKWVDLRTVQQSEAECGPRTIVGMVSLCQALVQGDPIEEAVAKSSGNSGNRQSLNSEEVRRKAVEWVKETGSTSTKYERQEAEIRKYLRKRRKNQRRNLTSTNQHDDDGKIYIELD